jgi:uncharacterized protein (TIGR00369 family)
MTKPIPDFEAQDPNYAARIRASFDQQAVMHTVGARLVQVAPGYIRVQLPFAQSLTQQHGYLHAGITTMIVDTACGYAASTLMPADSEVLSIEFKTNFLAPATGDSFTAVGQVIKAGRTITVCEGHVIAHQGAREKLIATMQASMFCVLT